MAEEPKNNVISINGKDYNTDDLNNEQKYAIQQLRDLQTRSDTLKFQLDQVAAAQKVFTDALIKSIEDPAEKAAAS